MQNSDGVNPEPKISFDDFKKVEMTVGKILSAEKIPDTDKLLKLSVDFGIKQNPSTRKTAVLSPTFLRRLRPLEKGEQDTPLNPPSKEEGRETRQIVSGIATYFPEPGVLVGKKCMFVTNLEPRVIRGFESNGMLFAVSTDDGKFSLLEPNEGVPEGTRAK